MKKNSQSKGRWVTHSIETDLLGENRKEGKTERKRLQAKDRTKFKKTDQDKYTKSIEADLAGKLKTENLFEGRVITIVPQGILVDHKGQIFSCILKGLLKKEKTQSKNLVAVGDIVLFEQINGNEGVIAHITPRKTFLSRADNLSRRKEQLIAVNIDQVIITVCIGNPPLKLPIIDRYIIATRKGGMDPIIVINKMDLLEHLQDPVAREQERLVFEEALEAYRKVNIPLIALSAVEGTGIDKLKEAMKDKTSVFSGPSGVGKSSLINAVTQLNLRVGDVVEKTKKGAHTTTTTNLIPLEFGGWCVDTPGIKSFGVWNLSIEEIQNYFPEIREFGLTCKYANCTHSHEEECAVIQALEEEKLSPLRFDSYQALLSSVREKHIRR